MSARVTVYDGVRCIGGNKILLEADGANLFLDFGTSYARRGLYYAEFLDPRAVRGLTDLLVMGLVPRVKGIYREDLRPGTVARILQQPDVPTVSAAYVLLSHAHLDHAGHVSVLREDLRIVCSAMTGFVLKAMRDCGRSGLEDETCYFAPQLVEGETVTALPWQSTPLVQRPFCFTEGPLAPEALSFWTTRPGSQRPRSRKFDSCVPTHAAALTSPRIRTFPVDHSIFGAMAYAVETNAGWVVYTGDLRLHGHRASLTQTFVEEAAALQPLALICEGTNVRHDSVPQTEPPVTEEQVYELCLRAVRAERGLVIADFGPRNVDRLMTFRRVAAECDRQMAVLAKDAYLLEAMRLLAPEVPDVGSDAQIRIYQQPKKDRDTWEQELWEKHAESVLSWEEVASAPGQFVVCLSLFDLKELVDLNIRGGGTYIYSNSEPHNEEQDIDFQRLRNWLEHFGMRLVGDPEKGERGFHASGHASPADLLWLVREIRPKVLIPVHTEHPEWFAEQLGAETKVVLPEIGQPIELG